MILVADMVRNLCPHIATDAVARRTSEGFATVKQDGKGWTWKPHAIGLGPLLPVPPVPYISQRVAKVAPSAADSDAPVGAEQKGQSTCLPMK